MQFLLEAKRFVVANNSPFKNFSKEVQYAPAVGNSCSGCAMCTGDGDGCGPGRFLAKIDNVSTGCEGCHHCMDACCR